MKLYTVDDAVPLVLTRTELAALLRKSVWQLDEHRRRKDHPAIKQLDGPGHARFCGRTARALGRRVRRTPSSRESRVAMSVCIGVRNALGPALLNGWV